MLNKVFGFLCVIALVRANAIQTENNLLDSVYQDCLKKGTLSCLKYKVFSFADKMLSQTDIPITEGVQIVKTSEPTQQRALSQDSTIEGALFNKFTSFLESHTLKIDVRGKDVVESAVNTARSISDVFTEEVEVDDEEARGKGGKKKIKKIKKMFGPIFGIVALKAAFLIKIALVGLALLATKAFFVSKIALILAGILGLKKLLSGGGLGGLGGKLGGGFGGSASTGHDLHGAYADSSYGGATYATSAHGSGWGRSSDAQKLAYQAYAANQS